MAGAAEQPPVQQRHLEQRDLQARQHCSQANGQIVITCNEPEHLLDQVDHVFVVTANEAAGTATHADGQQQLLQLLAKDEVISRAGLRHIVLQV